MDFDFIKNYIPLYIDAFILTIKIGLLGIVYSIIIGIIVSYIQYEKIKILNIFASIYIEVSRNTPLLVQLFFIYYALPKVNLKFGAELSGIIGLSFLGGGYMAETIRSGLEAVGKIQYEQSKALGLNKLQIYFYILLPQALIISSQGIIANIIFLLKETSVFSCIGLMDLMFTAKDLIGLYYKTIESLFLLVVFYLIILLPISILGLFVERKIRYGTFGN